MIEYIKQQFLNSIRKKKKINLSKKSEKITPPPLLQLQKKTYSDFLYSKNPLIYSLHNTIKNFFPIKNTLKTIFLKYKGYELKNTSHTLEECKLYGLTYSTSLELHIQICIKAEKEKKTIYKKNQNVYICEIPLMTNEGSFIINGTERAIVSQLCRAPGAYFSIKENETKKQYILEIIPYKGTWLEFVITSNNESFIKIDKKKKIPLSIFLHALENFKQKTLTNVFCFEYKIIITSKKKMYWKANNNCINTLSPFTIKNKKKYILKKNEIIYDLIEEKYFQINESELIGKIITTPIINKKNIEIIQKNTIITKRLLKVIKKEERIITIANNSKNCYKYLTTTTLSKQHSIEKKKHFYYSLNDLHSMSLIYIHNLLKQEEVTTEKMAKKFFQNLLFNENYYFLSAIGRDKINKTLHKKKIKNTNTNIYLLEKNDIFALTSKLFKIKEYHEKNENIKYATIENKSIHDFSSDNIDHIGNKRLKHVGELLSNQITIGLNKIKKATQEKLTSIETNKLQPKKALTTTPLMVLIKEFFCSSQFSQFIDQNNLLSNITHKRRITTTGPGGLTKSHASIAARDVHITNYGRICPIETPEGKNIGLVNSLALFTKIDINGTLKTPYRKIINNKLTTSINYLSAHEENNYKISQNMALVKKIKNSYVAYRYLGEFKTNFSQKIEYCDVSTYQILSIATALIPFVEHNDANRALMGSNMQRQAVPLLKPEIPYVKTGLENIVGRESALTTIINTNSNSILALNSKKVIIVKKENSIKTKSITNNIKIFWLKKYYRSNQNTNVNQKPVIKKKKNILKNTTIIDNSATVDGNLAIGQNILVAFMPWYGYNFEDSIIVSQNLVKSEKLSSINIEELDCIVKKTKLGKEKTTKELPNIPPDMTKKLNKNGIIKEGSYVKTNDILVGKTTPIGEIKTTPEEKLLKAIFGEKIDAVQNTSLIVPNGIYGIVSKVIVLTQNKKKNTYLKKKKEEITTEKQHLWKFQQNLIIKKIIYILKTYNKKIHNEEYFITSPLKELFLIFKENKIISIFLNLLKNFYNKYEKEKTLTIKTIEKRVGIPTNTLKIIKIYITTKRNLQQGDKLSGRHGNKGVVATVTPTEDMPHLEDGTPIEMILNPLSIPSRMNVGQLLETHLGLAINRIRHLFKIKNTITTKSQPFNGIKEKIIRNLLKICKLPSTGQLNIFDGKTGMLFHNPITVGYLYMLKLNHLADDKLHARCVGPYNIITQQPLGGKAQFGGQRFGEMEVWALEAFGAAYTLQELMTIKSDDLYGRVTTFKNIINGYQTIESTIPESFLVLQKELFALGLNLNIEYTLD